MLFLRNTAARRAWREAMALPFALTLFAFWPARVSGNHVAMAEFEAELLGPRAAAVRIDSARRYALECLVSGQAVRGLETLARFMGNDLGPDRRQRLSTPRLERVAGAADAYLLLRFQHQAAPQMIVRREVAEWLLGSDVGLRTFLDSISLRDDWRRVFEIVSALYDHDPAQRATFSRLILALALVWDQPRPPLHGQRGPAVLPFAVEVTGLYDYFRDLYGARRAKMAYDSLSVMALTLVVDVPVPLSELHWARAEVRGSARAWDRTYDLIRYETSREARAVYQWPHGIYSLAAIAEKGGICVDQAYFATLSARAWGIPALLFAGEGRRGPHAWFGYMRDRTTWDLDAGRFARDNYTVGHALNPQTNTVMTDHDVDFMASAALRSEGYSVASRFSRLASVLFDLGRFEAAAQGAELSIAHMPTHDQPWRVLELVLREQPDGAAALFELLERKAQAFRRFPDQVARIRREQADLLVRAGQQDQAQRLLARSQGELGGTRDDLARQLAAEQVRLATAGGDVSEARRKIEQLLDEQRDEGRKVLALIAAYLELTRDSGQTGAAALFLQRYVAGMQRRYRADPRTRAEALLLLQQAHRNNGDAPAAERAQRDLEHLR